MTMNQSVRTESWRRISSIGAVGRLARTTCDGSGRLEREPRFGQRCVEWLHILIFDVQAIPEGARRGELTLGGASPFSEAIGLPWNIIAHVVHVSAKNLEVRLLYAVVLCKRLSSLGH